MKVGTRRASALAPTWQWLLLLVAACGGQRRVPGAAGADRRQVIPVPFQASEAVRAEMRTMLASLQGILAASTADDTAAMRQAATRSGLAAAADPTLEKVLPEGFLRIGIATHRQFDDFASAVASGLPRDSVTARLAHLMGNCVSCHETYRLEVR